MADTISIAGDSGAGGDRLRKFQWTARAVQFADAIGPRLADRIRTEAPVAPTDGGGRLRDTTRYRRLSKVGIVRLEFHADGVPYVPFVLQPTAPHEIVPRAARMLHWTPPGGGDVFARKVNHPGTKGNNYPLRAARAMRDEIRSAFTAAFDDL